MAVTRFARICSALIALSAFAVQPANAQWTPPIGIPAPSFGITNVARSVPNPWTTSTPGFYYVEPTKVGATDTNNPYGTPGKPRLTIPTALAAGAVVELHGTYDASHSSPATIVASGTASAPVFIRGVSASAKPLARRSWELKGSYLVVENIEFGPMPDQSDTGSIVILLPSDHIAVRHSDLHGTLTGGGLGVVNWLVPYGTYYTGPGVIDNVVLWDNYVHDNGDVNATYDQDVHGISVSDHVRYLWVVDNQIARNSGDGLQVNAGDPSQALTTHHIYIGRNVSHNNKQTGIWIKSATDVVVSQNESYGHRPSNSSLGQSMGGQYAPDYVWFLFNHSHDNEYGIAQMSDNGETSHWFVIGNIVENIHASQASDPTNAWGPSAIFFSGGTERHIINNTVYNVDSGVNIATPNGPVEIADNIISTITQSAASHVILGFPQNSSNTAFHHNLLFGDARIDPGTGSQVHLTAAQLAQAYSLSSDPKFVNAAGSDFHIQLTSPARNTAEFNSAYATFLSRYGISIATDADGFPRPQATTTDMGAYLAAGAGGTPTADAASPASGSGTTQTFTLQYSDTAGAIDLSTAWVYFTPMMGGSAANSCLAYYSRATKVLNLLNDAGTAYVSATVGTSGTLQNTQCTIALGSSTTAALSGNTLTLNLAVTFKPAFAGTKNIYMYASTNAGANSGWQTRGSWTASAGGTPTADAVSPGSGSGTTQTFALQYSDTAGATDLSAAWVYITSTMGASAANSCLAYYSRPTNVLNLLNDAGTAYVSAALGTAGTLQNSQCAIALGSSTTAALSGNTLTLNLAVTFRAAFTGTKNIYMYAATNAGANSGWQTRGSWTVGSGTGPGTPTADAVSPAAGSGATQTFALQYSDTAGATDLSAAWVWINASMGSAANSCLAYYSRATNVLNLLNDAATAYTAATVGTSGTLQNSQCAIALGSSTTVVVSGNTLTLNLAVTFKSAFAGAKSVYMYASSTAGVGSGWQTRGAWTTGAVGTPGADAVSPASGSGTTQTFALQYSDTAGAADLSATWVWINATMGSSSVSSCLAYYSRATNVLNLLNDAATGYVSGTVGTSGTLQNSQCSIALGSSTTVAVSSNTLTLNLAVTFKAAYSGAKNVYMFATTNGGVGSGWQTRGTWTAP